MEKRGHYTTEENGNWVLWWPANGCYYSWRNVKTKKGFTFLYCGVCFTFFFFSFSSETKFLPDTNKRAFCSRAAASFVKKSNETLFICTIHVNTTQLIPLFFHLASIYIFFFFFFFTFYLYYYIEFNVRNRFFFLKWEIENKKGYI